MFQTFDIKSNILFYSMLSITFYFLLSSNGICRNSLHTIFHFCTSEKGFLKCSAAGIISQVQQRCFASAAYSFSDLFQSTKLNGYDAGGSLTVVIIILLSFILNYRCNLIFSHLRVCKNGNFFLMLSGWFLVVCVDFFVCLFSFKP